VPVYQPLPSLRYAPAAKRIKKWRRIARWSQTGWLTSLLQEIEREQEVRVTAERSAGWLLPWRSQFRRLADVEPAAIRLYLLDCPDRMTPIAVWMLGRCATRVQHFDLLEFASDASPPTRRHAARALRRVEAWEKVTRLADAAPDDRRLAWYAHAPTTKRVFAARLQNFAEHLDRAHAAEASGPSRMSLWFADLDWVRRPPKSVAVIRQILQRIRRWVHGEST
jgi:hypothetical protein